MGKERERNIDMWLFLACHHLGTPPATQACALTGNQTSNPLVHRPSLNPLSQGRFNVFVTFCLNHSYHTVNYYNHSHK